MTLINIYQVFSASAIEVILHSYCMKRSCWLVNKRLLGCQLCMAHKVDAQDATIDLALLVIIIRQLDVSNVSIQICY